MSFDELWRDIWKTDNISNQYKVEEVISKDKFNSLKNGILNRNVFYSIETIIQETNDDTWHEPEWGFPKGRRNYMEKDYECAIREFVEETGFDINKMKNVQNVLPFEEIFTGSNYKSYKHKYFLSFIHYDETMPMDKFEKSEVSKMEWNSYEECLIKIRPYNLEKKRLITNIHNTLTQFRVLGY
jgi:8-oxo-dGTP pyrophosphatase MutT (NUDIX family)